MWGPAGRLKRQYRNTLDLVAAREGALNVCTCVVVQAERLLTDTHSRNTHVLARNIVPPMWNNYEAAIILRDLYELEGTAHPLGDRLIGQQTTDG